MPTLIVSLALHCVLGGLEIISSCFIIYQAIRHPKMIRNFLAVFSIITLPASAFNILSTVGYVSLHWNSFLYLITTFCLLVIHFWLILDIGLHLRVSKSKWKNPVILIALLGLCGSLSCLATQVVIILLNNDNYPKRSAFVSGVCLAIFSHGLAYCNTFVALIDFRAGRANKGPAKTAALGVWFLAIQFVWYTFYGILYIWFFCMNWEQFPILLAFDYLMRFVLCFMFAWPPPSFLIKALTDRFSSQTTSQDMYSRENESNTKSSSKVSSTQKHNYAILEKPPLCNTTENPFKNIQH